MIEFNELQKELKKQLKNCDPFFQEPKYQMIVCFYIIYICKKKLGNVKHNIDIKPYQKRDILVDIISRKKRLSGIVITQRKIKRYSEKEYELLDQHE